MTKIELQNEIIRLASYARSFDGIMYGRDDKMAPIIVQALYLQANADIRLVVAVLAQQDKEALAPWIEEAKKDLAEKDQYDLERKKKSDEALNNLLNAVFAPQTKPETQV